MQTFDFIKDTENLLNTIVSIHNVHDIEQDASFKNVQAQWEHEKRKLNERAKQQAQHVNKRQRRREKFESVE